MALALYLAAIVLTCIGVTMAIQGFKVLLPGWATYAAGLAAALETYPPACHWVLQLELARTWPDRRPHDGVCDSAGPGRQPRWWLFGAAEPASRRPVGCGCISGHGDGERHLAALLSVPADIASQYWLLAITILVGPAAGVLVAAASRRWRRDRMTMIGQTLTTIVGRAPTSRKATWQSPNTPLLLRCSSRS
jgi:hypothetical protein